MLTCSKIYTDIPFAHRQPAHKGHCFWIHGHNWSFEFTFKAQEVDESGFVVDFGRLKELKDFLNEFDHAFVTNESDPEVSLWKELEAKKLLKLVLVPDVSAEGFAQFVFQKSNEIVLKLTANRVCVTEVIVWEDSKNKATYSE